VNSQTRTFWEQDGGIHRSRRNTMFEMTLDPERRLSAIRRTSDGTNVPVDGTQQSYAEFLTWLSRQPEELWPSGYQKRLVPGTYFAEQAPFIGQWKGRIDLLHANSDDDAMLRIKGDILVVANYRAQPFHLSSARRHRRASGSSRAVAPRPETHTLFCMKVLLVEDDARTAIYPRRGLSEHGFVPDSRS
jgi:hypothetical protein